MMIYFNIFEVTKTKKTSKHQNKTELNASFLAVGDIQCNISCNKTAYFCYQVHADLVWQEKLQTCGLYRKFISNTVRKPKNFKSPIQLLKVIFF